MLLKSLKTQKDGTNMLSSLAYMLPKRNLEGYNSNQGFVWTWSFGMSQNGSSTTSPTTYSNTWQLLSHHNGNFGGQAGAKLEIAHYT